MDTEAAIGILAAPGLIAGLLGIIKWGVIERVSWLGFADVKRAIAVALGVCYGVVANASGLIEADNAIIAGMLGITLGLAAIGWREGVPGASNFGNQGGNG